MKMLKDNKGITLVALIITIIVLLILAVVTIASVTGDGIIGKAKEAKSKYEDAQARENSLLQNYLSQMEGIIGNNTSIGENTLPEGENPEETTITWTDNGDGTFTSSDGRIVQTGDILTNEEVLQATGGTQSTYTGTWTVIGIKDGRLKLISTTNVQENVYLGYQDPKAIEALPNGTDYERAIWSYKNAVNTLNTVAKTATGIESAESIKIEDIYDILGEENINKGTNYGKVVCNFYYDITNSKVYSKYQKGTDENGNITWSTKYNTEYKSQTFVNEAGETVVIDSAGDEVILTYTHFAHNITDEQKEKLGSLSNMNYWLASPCLFCRSNNMRYDLAGFCVRVVNGGIIYSDDLFYSNGNKYSKYYGVCAVVYV